MQFGDSGVIALLGHIEGFIKKIKKDKELRIVCGELKLLPQYKIYKQNRKEAKEAAKEQKAGSDIAYRNSIAKKIQLKFLEQVAREKYKEDILNISK